MTVTARPTGHPGYSQAMPRTHQAIATARGLVRDALAAWKLDQHTYVGELVINELVANAVFHTQSSTLNVSIDRPAPSVVRMYVTDNSHARPVLKALTYDQEHGRGLALVDAYATSWGTDVEHWGKRVWAEIRT